MFQNQPEPSKQSQPKPNLTAALIRDAAHLSDDAQALCETEIDRIYELLMREPERWDGMS